MENEENFCEKITKCKHNWLETTESGAYLYREGMQRTTYRCTRCNQTRVAETFKVQYS